MNWRAIQDLETNMRRSIAGLIVAVTLGTLAASLAFAAQQPPKIPRIGVLHPGSPPDANVEVFRQGLRALGYEEGKNIAFEYRWAEGKLDRLPDLATDLARAKVDLIVTSTTPAIQAAKNATTTIPIVFAAAGDPVATGLVAGLARPGGNITGLSLLSAELSGKRLELLKETVPGISRVAVLWNTASVAMALTVKEVQAAAVTLGVTPHMVGVRHPDDFAGVFAAIARARPDALVVVLDPFTLVHRKRILEFASANRLPAMYETRIFVDEGGLMAYGPSVADMWRRAAAYVDKILKGTKPADLPVEQPTRFELVINFKTAKALGLTFPQTILIRADHMIQ